MRILPPLFLLLLLVAQALQSQDPLPAWNEGLAKSAILQFVQEATDEKSPHFIPKEERITTFDNDGTLWVEHPLYTQAVFCIDQVPVYAKKHPETANQEPFKTVLEQGKNAIKTLSFKDRVALFLVVQSGMSPEEYTKTVKTWLQEARHPRWNRPYTALTYLPMLQVLAYLRENGFKTYIATSGGQGFVRTISEATYGIPVKQVIGTAEDTRLTEEGTLIKEPKLILSQDEGRKPQGIELIIGRRPVMAFGNSSGDKTMLEYTTSGNGKRLGFLVLHDDGEREYAYGPAKGLPNTDIGTFPESLYQEALKRGWIVISMKDDWKEIFSFPSSPPQ